MNSLVVTVIDTVEGFQQLAPRWNPLLDESRSTSVFLTWEWLSAWVECFLTRCRSLYILTIEENGLLVGIAPLYIERNKFGPFTLRTIRLLGAPEAGSDYLDVFSRRRHEKEIAYAVYDYLMSEGKNQWDVIHLQDIPSDSLFLLNFNKRFQLDGKFAETAFSAYCPVVKCSNEDELFAWLSPETRKKFRKYMRAMQQEPDFIHLVIHGDEVAGALDEFFSFFEMKTKFSGRNLQSILNSFVTRCNGNCPVQIDLLSFSGQTVAGLLHLTYRNTIASYMIVADKEFNSKISLGNLLVGLCIKNSINAGYIAYDLLKGDESYKFHWANEGNSTMQLIFWQKRPVALASGLTRLLRYAGKIILR